MSLQELTTRIEHIATAWEQFKEKNDERLTQLERKGRVDPLTTQHLQALEVQLQQKSSQESMQFAERPLAMTQHHAMDRDASVHHKAFMQYLRLGEDQHLGALQSKALRASSDGEGGYLVSTPMHRMMVERLQELVPMRNLAQVQTIGTESMEIIEDVGQFEAGWADEITLRNTTATPQLSRRVLATYELYAQPSATQRLIDDVAMNLEEWLTGRLVDTFAKLENTAFIQGGGNGKPRGILSYPNGTDWGKIEQVTSLTSGQIHGDDLIILLHSLKEAYAGRASFLMHRSTLQSVRLLKAESTGQYLWQPGLAAGVPDTLLGIPVYTTSAMPTISQGALAVAVGDFKTGYGIIDRSGMTLLRDPFTEKPFVKFYTTRRVGGDVLNFEAIKLLKLAA